MHACLADMTVCIKWTDKDHMEPPCCGMGMGYERPGGAPPTSNEIMAR